MPQLPGVAVARRPIPGGISARHALLRPLAAALSQLLEYYLAFNLAIKYCGMLGYFTSGAPG